MATTTTIKQEQLLENENIKQESNEPGQFKIINVFSIPAIPHTQSLEDVKPYSREMDFQFHDGHPDRQPNFPPPAHFRKNKKSAKKQRVTEASNGPALEDTASDRRYGFRARSVRTYDDNLEEPNFPTPPQNTKKHKSKLRKMEDVLKCDICSTAFFNIQSLEEHVVEMHVVDKEFKCAECTKSFISQDELDRHMEEHENEEEEPDGHKCPICSKKFAEKRYMDSHVKTHNTVKPFKCKECPKSYIRQIDLQRHGMNQHGKEKKYKCSKCPKSYALNHLLQDHIRTHSNAKTIVCENCSLSFKTKLSLREHRSYCKGKSSENNLAGKKSEKAQSKECNAAENTLNYQYKQYKCSVCDLVKRSFSRLKDHMLTHTDEKNYKCNFCPKSFLRRINLRQHQEQKHRQSQKLKNS